MLTSAEVARRIRLYLSKNPDIKSVSVEEKSDGVALWVLGASHTVAVHVAECKDVPAPTKANYQELDDAIVTALRFGAFKRIEIYRDVEPLLMNHWRGGRKYFMKVLDDRLAHLKRRGVVRSSRQGYGWVLHSMQPVTKGTAQ